MKTVTGFVVTDDGLLVTDAHVACRLQSVTRWKILSDLIDIAGKKDFKVCILKPLVINTVTDYLK